MWIFLCYYRHATHVWRPYCSKSEGHINLPFPFLPHHVTPDACTHTHTHIHTHTYTHTQTLTHTHTHYTHKHTHTHTHAHTQYTHTHTHACSATHTRTRTHTHTHTHTNTHAYTYTLHSQTHIRTYTHMHAHTHTHKQTDEFKSLIEEDHYDWVAQYLVMKRASIEPNFHNLYMSFLDYLGSLRLRKGALRETYRNIKVCHNMVHDLRRKECLIRR